MVTGNECSFDVHELDRYEPPATAGSPVSLFCPGTCNACLAHDEVCSSVCDACAACMTSGACDFFADGVWEGGYNGCNADSGLSSCINCIPCFPNFSCEGAEQPAATNTEVLLCADDPSGLFFESTDFSNCDEVLKEVGGDCTYDAGDLTANSEPPASPGTHISLFCPKKCDKCSPAEEEVCEVCQACGPCYAAGACDTIQEGLYTGGKLLSPFLRPHDTPSFCPWHVALLITSYKTDDNNTGYAGCNVDGGLSSCRNCVYCFPGDLSILSLTTKYTVALNCDASLNYKLLRTQPTFSSESPCGIDAELADLDKPMHTDEESVLIALVELGILTHANCTDAGVICKDVAEDGTMHVVSLTSDGGSHDSHDIGTSLSGLPELTHLSLRGQISILLDSLKDLKKLKVLDLDHGNASGNLESLASLTELIALRLNNNAKVSGSVESLAALTKLTEIGLSGLVKVIGSLASLKTTRLTSIDARNTLLSGDLAQLATLGQDTVAYVNFGNTRVSGSLAGLETLKNLQYLDLANADVGGNLQSLATLPLKMTYLDVSGTEVTGSLADLAGQHKLGTIIVSRSTVTGTVSSLEALSGLARLDIATTSVQGSCKSLARHSELTYADLSHSQLEGPVDGLANLTKLKTLVMANMSLSGPLPPLATLTRLVRLVLAGNDFTGVIPSLPDTLQHLDLAGNRLYSSSDDMTVLTEGEPPTLSLVLPADTKFLDLSSNKIKGALLAAWPDANFENHAVVNIRTNSFICPFPAKTSKPKLIVLHDACQSDYSLLFIVGGTLIVGRPFSPIALLPVLRSHFLPLPHIITHSHICTLKLPSTHAYSGLATKRRLLLVAQKNP